MTKFAQIPADQLATLITVTHQSAKLIDFYKIHAQHFNTIYIVDNASTDETVRLFKLNLPKSTIISNPVNSGFGAANNTAFNLCRSSQFVLFLNPDCQISVADAKLLQQTLQNNPNIAIACPVIFTPEGHPIGIKIRDYSLGYGCSTVKSILPSSQLPELIYNAAIDGSCFMVRCDDFHRIGAFDPNLFMYSEEDDIGLRISSIGKQIVVNSRCRAVHIGGSSSHPNLRISIRKSYHAKWSRLYMLQKHLGTRKRLVAALKTLTVSPLAIIFYSLLMQKRLAIKWIGGTLAAFDGLFMSRIFHSII